MVTVGTDLPSCYAAVTTAADHDPVYAAVAIHPNETAKAGGAGRRAGACRRSAELAALPQVRAVGETGLDYYWDDAPHGCSRTGSARTSRSPSRRARR